MRRLYTVLLLALISFSLIACGKFAEKFSRLRKDYTLVNFSTDRESYESMATQLGGVMVYVVNQTGGAYSVFLGYANEDLDSATIAIPNGTYKIYAIGYAGSSIGGGQVRCGYGNGGSLVTFNGTAQTVPVNLNQATCSFGSNSDFAWAANANQPSNTNFDSWTINLCSGSAYPSCTAASASSHGVKVTLMAGSGVPSGLGSENTSQSLVSVCRPEASASFSFSSSFLNAPIAPGFPMPLKIEFYADSSCASTVSRTFSFTNGLRDYLSVSSGSSVYVYSPASSSTTYIDITKDF